MPRQPRDAALAFIFVTVVLDSFAFGMIAPVLPRIVVELSGNDSGRGSLVVAVFAAVFQIAQFVFSPLQGALSDRFGRRPLILISNLGIGLDYIFMAVAHSVPLLFFGRLISGVTAANLATAGAYIADVTPPKGERPDLA